MAQLHFAVLLLAAAAPATALPNAEDTYSYHSARLRAHLLNETYEKMAVPISSRSDGGTDGTLVRFALRIFKVQHVDTSTGSLRLKVWFRLRWTDLRLAWDPAEFGGVTQAHMRAAAITNDQDSDIWLPDVQPYNAGEAISSTLEPSIALVSSSGSVYWSRQGTLDVLCKFRGLNRFPSHMSLRCPIDFGGWLLSGTYQGLDLLEDRTEVYDSINGSEESAGSSYAEWTVGNVSARVETRTYPCCPNEPWPVVSYRVTLARARSTPFYNMHLLVPSIIFSVLALLACFLSPDSGERIGLCVTLLLAREFGQAILTTLLPICNEALWIDYFEILNEIATCLPLIETVVVIFFYYRDSEFFSATMQKLFAKLWPAANNAQRAREDERESASARLLRMALEDVPPPEPASTAAQEEHEGNPPDGIQLDGKTPAEATASAEAGAATVEKATAKLAPATAAPAAATESADQSMSGWDAINDAPRRLAPTGEAGLGISPKEYSRLIFLERLFFALDLDGLHSVRFEEVDRFLSFVAFDLTQAERARLIIHGQRTRLESLSELASGQFYREQLSQISRAEFVRICLDALGDKTDKEIETAAATFRSAQKLRRKATLISMRGVAESIDKYFRMVALPTYLISLIALWWVIEPMDDDDGARIDVKPGGLVLTILLVILTLTFSRLYMYADARLVAAEEDEQSQRLVELLATQQHGPALQRLLQRMRSEAPDERPQGSMRNLFGSSKALVRPEGMQTRVVEPRPGGTGGKRAKQTTKPVWK